MDEFVANKLQEWNLTEKLQVVFKGKMVLGPVSPIVNKSSVTYLTNNFYLYVKEKVVSPNNFDVQLTISITTVFKIIFLLIVPKNIKLF
jgi:hypothetical protein